MFARIGGETAAVDSIERESLRDAAELPGGRNDHPRPQFDIFRLAEAFVEPADPGTVLSLDREGDVIKCGAAQDGRGAVADRVAAKDVLSVDVHEPGGLHEPQVAALIVDQAGTGKAHAEVGIGREMIAVPREFAWVPGVVGVEQGDEAPACVSDACVAGAGKAAVCLRQQRDARIFTHEPAHKGGAAIC